MADHKGSNIVLIGYRGSGKSTVGRLLAERLGRTYVDTDTLIEAEASVTIAEVFAREGEAGFRHREAEAITRVAQGERQVVSVGGGAVLNQVNVERLGACGTVVWLTAPAEVLWERISRDARSGQTRPNLTEQGGLEEVRRVLAARQQAYRSAADWTVSTEDRSPQEVVAAIVAQLAEGGER
ncbi:MAG: shikimate kinase [Planctomycetota bacterium]